MSPIRDSEDLFRKGSWRHSRGRSLQAKVPFVVELHV